MKDKKKKKGTGEPVAKVEPDTLKLNQNPAANANIPEVEKSASKASDKTGVGSEITDGEDG